MGLYGSAGAWLDGAGSVPKQNDSAYRNTRWRRTLRTCAHVLKKPMHFHRLCCHADEFIAYLQKRGSGRLNSFQSKAFVTAGAKLTKEELGMRLFDTVHGRRVCMTCAAQAAIGWRAATPMRPARPGRARRRGSRGKAAPAIENSVGRGQYLGGVATRGALFPECEISARPSRMPASLASICTGVGGVVGLLGL